MEFETLLLLNKIVEIVNIFLKFSDSFGLFTGKTSYGKNRVRRGTKVGQPINIHNFRHFNG